MRSLPERPRSGSGIIPLTDIPNAIDGRPLDDGEFYVVRLKALLTLYVWLTVVILCGLTGLTNFSSEDIGAFVAGSGAVLSVAGILLILLPRNESAIRCVIGAVFFCLFFIPQNWLPPADSRTVLFDLYMVLLVVVPALLRVWPWHYQAACGLVTVLSAAGKLFVDSSFFRTQSLVLVSFAAVLSTLIIFIRRDEFDVQNFRWKMTASGLLHEVSLRRLPQQIWSIMLLEAGLLVVLIFLDISLRQGNFSEPIVPKIWGLIAIVFGGAASVTLRSERIPRAVMLTTLTVAVMLSLVRISYGDLYSASFAFPLIYLLLASAPLHWTVEMQLQLAWATLLADIWIKVWSREPSAGLSWYEVVGRTLEVYRGEVLLLTLGGAASILAASAVRRYRFSHLSQFVDLYDEAGNVSAAKRGIEEPLRQQTLPSSSHLTVLPERNRQLLFGLFCLGVLSCALSSKLLLLQGGKYGGLVVGTWIAFLACWGLLLNQDRKDYHWPHFWGLGAALQVLFTLWPTMLLLVQSDSGNYWLLWPVCLLFGIGMIPWTLRELVPILLITSALGTEVIYRLSLGIVGGSMFLGAGVLSVLLSVQCARRIRERYLFTNFHEALLTCKTDVEVLRVLADYLSQLFDTTSALLSAGPEHLEFLRGNVAFFLDKDDWPIIELRETAGKMSRNASGIGLKPMSWLPPKLSFFDKRVGIVTPNCGLLMDLGAVRERRFLQPESQAEENASGVSRLLLFVITPFPVYEGVRKQELTIARMLAAIAKLKISSFYEAEEQKRLNQIVDSQATQREYELSALVHDINNTVQDLTLLCELILEDAEQDSLDRRGTAENSEIVKRVTRIAAIARSVATVVSDAKRRRELEKLEDLTPRELVEVREVIRELVSFAGIRAERKRILIEQPRLPDEPVYVLISVREHLETILRNILNNAIMYSQPGASIRVEVRIDQTTVWIDVTDTGAGMTPEETKSVFLPGFRGKAATSLHHGGLGLGLAESLRVARAAGGDITASSPGLGRGSTFSIVLPRQHRPSYSNVSHHWALLVDDQPALTDFYSRIARAMQLQPEVAASVEDAMLIVRTRGRPTLVVTDIHLGSSDGLDLVQKLRTEFGNQLPIIVISGLTSEEIIHRVREVGATDFVAKPVGRRALFARIQSLLSN
jgi:signal transduction histidine kinase/CheY-like chemotaxis protein